MKVHLIKQQTIENFIQSNAQSKTPFETWISILKQADWCVPNDMISTFSSADIIGNGSERVAFNIGGNNYRMICKYYFGEEKTHLSIKWIGTHAQYSQLCSVGKQYDINMY